MHTPHYEILLHLFVSMFIVDFGESLQVRNEERKKGEF